MENAMTALVWNGWNVNLIYQTTNAGMDNVFQVSKL
jgi:hypothetical protein